MVKQNKDFHMLQVNIDPNYRKKLIILAKRNGLSQAGFIRLHVYREINLQFPDPLNSFKQMEQKNKQ